MVVLTKKKNIVVDPYKALNLPHSATFAEIKKSYRDLARQFHPDRLLSASEEEKDEANKNFSRISEAYSLLMDPQRKAQYDHIYKYGGYDDDDDDDDGEEEMRHGGINENHRPTQFHRGPATTSNMHTRKRKSMGIGYQCHDPFTYLWTSGKVHSTTNVAGVHIPSRYEMAAPGAGVRLSFSKGEVRYGWDGSHHFKSRTTQFSHGKKETRVETTTIRKDGRKTTTIEGDNFVETFTSLVQPPDSLPWYLTAWSAVQDNIKQCYRPTCNAVKMN
jgi:hypothetical protein